MDYASQIETILGNVKYAIPDVAFIRSKPYKQIEDTLEHLKSDEPDLELRIENFERAYQDMRDESIDEMLERGMDLSVMIKDLEKIMSRINDRKTIEMFSLD